MSVKPFGVNRDGDGDVDVVIGREDGTFNFSKTIGIETGHPDTFVSHKYP